MSLALRVLARRSTPMVRVHHEPPSLSGEMMGQCPLAWAERANRSGAAYLTPAALDARWMASISIGAIPTERAHVEALWATIQREAKSLLP